MYSRQTVEAAVAEMRTSTVAIMALSPAAAPLVDPAGLAAAAFVAGEARADSTTPSASPGAHLAASPPSGAACAVPLVAAASSAASLLTFELYQYLQRKVSPSLSHGLSEGFSAGLQLPLLLRLLLL